MTFLPIVSAKTRIANNRAVPEPLIHQNAPPEWWQKEIIEPLLQGKKVFAHSNAAPSIMPNLASFAKWYVSGISHSRNCKMRNFISAVEATTLHLICSFDFPFLRVVPRRCLRLHKWLLNSAFNSFWFLVRSIEFWNLQSLNLQLLHFADSFGHHISHFSIEHRIAKREIKVEIKLSLIIFLLN